MRKEPFFVGDLVHVFNRGNRKQEIVRDDRDKQYFLQALYYFNNVESIPHMFESIARFDLSEFRWPKEFPEHSHLVKIHAFILKNNHFHLILEEIREGGISEFMRKLSTGMTCRFNKRYDETGKLFQGSYKARRVDKDNYLTYLNAYIHIKNALEIYDDGIENAMKDFDNAYEFAKKYPYSSLSVYEGIESPLLKIVSTDWLKEFFADQDFKEFARNCIETVGFDEKTLDIQVR